MSFIRTGVILALAAAFSFGAAGTAMAVTPVVDQYTEQLPDPGGPPNNQPDKNPTKPSKPDKDPTGNYSYGDDSGYDSASGAGAGAGAAILKRSKSNGDKDCKKGKPCSEGAAAVSKMDLDKKSRDEAPAGGASSDARAEVASGVRGGSGMGWLFPMALVSVAGVVAGFIIGRRNRGTLAT